MKYRDFVKILRQNGFTKVPNTNAGSHEKYTAYVGGKRRVVAVSAHRPGDDIKKGVLASMIRQSGLPRNKFP